MTAVADSGPLIHLATAGQFHLLNRYFQKLLIVPEVYGEIVIQGEGRYGQAELKQAVTDGWVLVEPVKDDALVQSLAVPTMSKTDTVVLAFALERKATLILTDDSMLRGLAEQEGLRVMGSIGILTVARLDGLLSELKPVLDRLIDLGFYLEPNGPVYRDALRKVRELE